MLKDCYHFCTTALKDTVLCQDRTDYRRLWNCIVLCAVKFNIRIFCICLMSNHFHILLQATPGQIESFCLEIKILFGRYLKKKYGHSTASKLTYRLFDIQSRRAFCQEVAYILRNAYKARISSPLSYPWCSTPIYFSKQPRQGRKTKEMTVREIATTLNTREKLPGDLLVSPEGIILPESFIDSAIVERMFENSPVLFFDLLKKWNLEDIVDGTHGETVSDAYSDNEVIVGIGNICKEDFGGMSPIRMDQKTVGRLARKVYSRYGSNRAQLLRLLPVDDFLLDRVL